MANDLAVPSSSAPLSNKDLLSKIESAQKTKSRRKSYGPERYQRYKEAARAYNQRPDVKARQMAWQRARRREKKEKRLAQPLQPSVIRVRAKRSPLPSPAEQELRRRERDRLRNRKFSEKQRQLREAQEKEQRHARLGSLTEAQKASLLAENKRAQQWALGQLYGGTPPPWEHWQAKKAAVSIGQDRLLKVAPRVHRSEHDGGSDSPSLSSSSSSEAWAAALHQHLVSSSSSSSPTPSDSRAARPPLSSPVHSDDSGSSLGSFANLLEDDLASH